MTLECGTKAVVGLKVIVHRPEANYQAEIVEIGAGLAKVKYDDGPVCPACEAGEHDTIVSELHGRLMRCACPCHPPAKSREDCEGE